MNDSNRISVYNKKEGPRIAGFFQGFGLRISADFLEDGKYLLLSVRTCCCSSYVITNFPDLIGEGENICHPSCRNFRAIFEVEIRTESKAFM